MDRITNDVIRRELEVIAILDTIELKKLGWYGHLVKMKGD